MKYTDTHEWIENKDGIAIMGVTQYAQKELGDIVYVELPTIGRDINAGQELAVLESTKAAADVYSPATGTIIEVNTQLSTHPEWINQSPEDKGWIVKIRLSNPAELELLMDQAAYQKKIEG
jgi:glycine cleavage system H protein